MFKALILPLALSLSVLSCGVSEEATLDTTTTGPQETVATESGAPKAQTVAIESAVRELRCGCSIDSINQCGNYVAVGDEWLEISNPDDVHIGTMEWCKDKAHTVEGTVAGERDGDKIKVATLEVAGK